jgi:hypothetical protein
MILVVMVDCLRMGREGKGRRRETDGRTLGRISAEKRVRDLGCDSGYSVLRLR